MTLDHGHFLWHNIPWMALYFGKTKYCMDDLEIVKDIRSGNFHYMDSLLHTYHVLSNILAYKKCCDHNEKYTHKRQYRKYAHK